MKTLRLPARLLGALSAVGLFAAQGAEAQRNLVQQFEAATVVLTSGDTLRGPAALHTDRDVLLVNLPDHSVRTVPALAVAGFATRGEKQQPAGYFDQYYDFYDARRGYFFGNPSWGPLPMQARRQRPDTARVREFRTFRWNRGNDYSDFRSPAFFEQLSRGPVLLLRRESLMERPVSAADPMFRPYYANAPIGALPRGTMGYYTTIRDQFFLGTPEGNLLMLRNPKRDLLAYFKPEAERIERYAKEHRLSFGDAHELAFIVNYANALRQPAP
ncbi:hypothetical protein D3Y59_05180 [Hymenobacter oligotrophus]|uniref:Uncharacterized protein n=1 Tax=Hymenobacter oligotrophus TaxID=2319843 RepID=A0A3B7R4T8_9BACT|nr:hypothetical protein [Hymenobacter oligotrophus]AYA36501.1 hypothetical protein D3Y59_05180 [Hymenobacter oligotrophus]